MSIESSALDFVSLYLGPFLPRKNLDLLKLKLIRRARRAKLQDAALSEVILIRQSLEAILAKRKSILSQSDPRRLNSPVFLELVKLPPADALLLCSDELFPIPMKSLALALQQPEESLRHRVSQLRARFQQQNLSLSPLKDAIPQKQGRTKSLRIRGRDLLISFQSLPMGVRFFVETSLVLVLLLVMLWFIPEVRNRYESSIQSRINEYLIESALLDAPPPEGTSRKPVAPLAPEGSEVEGEAEEALAKSSSEPTTQKRQPKVSEGETWRFSFTGSATAELESGILSCLKTLKIPEQKALNVPGGIQFDFLLETGKLLTLKGQLENTVGDLQRRSPGGAQVNPLAYANLSWYKKRNMGTRKIPQGHVQVILWISTL